MGRPSGSLTENVRKVPCQNSSCKFSLFIQFGNPDCWEINTCSSGKGGQHELLPTHLRAFSLFSPFLIPLFCFAPSVKCSRFPAQSFFGCRSNPSSVYGFSRSHYSQWACKDSQIKVKKTFWWVREIERAREVSQIKQLQPRKLISGIF